MVVLRTVTTDEASGREVAVNEFTTFILGKGEGARGGSKEARAWAWDVVVRRVEDGGGNPAADRGLLPLQLASRRLSWSPGAQAKALRPTPATHLGAGILRCTSLHAAWP